MLWFAREKQWFFGQKKGAFKPIKIGVFTDAGRKMNKTAADEKQG